MAYCSETFGMYYYSVYIHNYNKSVGRSCQVFWTMCTKKVALLSQKSERYTRETGGTFTKVAWCLGSRPNVPCMSARWTKAGQPSKRVSSAM